MTIIGIIVAAGALIHTGLFGIQLISLVYLALGIIVAAAAILVRRRQKNRGITGITFYNMSLLGILLAGVIAVPLVFPESSPLNEINQSLQKSADLMAGTKYEEAEKVLSAELEKYPGVPRLYVNLSTALLMQGKSEETISLLEEGEINKSIPMDGSVLFNKAMAYYQKKEYEESLDILKNVLLQNPAMPEAWLYAGEAAARLKDFKAAGYFASTAASLWPEKADYRFQFAKIKLMTMEYNEADRQLDEALKLDPEPKLREEILKLKTETEYYKSRL